MFKIIHIISGTVGFFGAFFVFMLNFRQKHILIFETTSHTLTNYRSPFLRVLVSTKSVLREMEREGLKKIINSKIYLKCTKREK